MDKKFNREIFKSFVGGILILNGLPQPKDFIKSFIIDSFITDNFSPIINNIWNISSYFNNFIGYIYDIKDLLNAYS
jgi:hypothetical protein